MKWSDLYGQSATGDVVWPEVTTVTNQAQCVTLDINTWTRLGIIFYAVHEI